MHEILADITHLARRFDHESARVDFWREHGNPELANRNMQRAIRTCAQLRELERRAFPDAA